MFTIKVISKMHGEEVTNLFEAVNPQYKYVSFNDYKDYTEKFNQITDGFRIPVEIMMEDILDGDKDGQLLSILYESPTDDRIKLILTRNAVMYVMQNGQTVDKVYC